MRVPTFDQALFEYCNNPTPQQIKENVTSSIKHNDHSVEGDFGEYQFCINRFVFLSFLMLYKASTCKLFWLCAVVFFHNSYSFKTIFFLLINLQIEHTLGKCYKEP